MTEIVPSTLANGQALKLVRELIEDAQDRSFEENLSVLTDILGSFQSGVNSPLLRYEPVVETEPPTTEKTNRTWQRIENDINLLKNQCDFVRASTMFTHNILATETQDIVKKNARLEGKVKSLQLYAVDDSPGVVSFSDTFDDASGIDLEGVTSEQKPSVLAQGNVTLGVTGEAVNHSPDATIRIGERSNGFLGNNQELVSVNDFPSNPANGEPFYEFKAANRDYRNLEQLTDNSPDTWIEYENFWVEESVPNSRVLTYRHITTEGSSELVNWGQRPADGILNLQLNFEFEEPKIINRVEVNPKSFGEKDNPIYIKSVSVSSNGTEWDMVGGDIWIGSNPSIRTARAAHDILIGSGVWEFTSRSVSYVRIRFEQPEYMKTNAGYIYWVDPDDGEQRVDGPRPNTAEPEDLLDQLRVDGLLQQRGYVPAKRWAIGLTDVSIMKHTYKEEAKMISTPLRVGNIVDRVTLDDVNMTIPDEYTDEEQWLRFYISPDDGDTWHQISPVQDDFNGVPEQIAYNDPTAEPFREANVGYFDVDGTVDTLRFKTEFTRPSGFSGTTPILHSYTLKVLKRDS